MQDLTESDKLRVIYTPLLVFARTHILWLSNRLVVLVVFFVCACHKFRLSSVDAVHSFVVGSSGLKVDCVPGRCNEVVMIVLYRCSVSQAVFPGRRLSCPCLVRAFCLPALLSIFEFLRFANILELGSKGALCSCLTEVLYINLPKFGVTKVGSARPPLR